MSSCVTAPVVVIGAVCRLPDSVASLGGLWPMLAQGCEARQKAAAYVR